MIQHSFIHHNTAPYTGSGTGVAGDIEHFGPSMTVINSTFSHNTSGYFTPTGNLRDSNPAGNTSVAFSTISDNIQDGLFTSGGNFTVENSIIANNSGQNYNAGTFTSGDYNLVSNADVITEDWNISVGTPGLLAGDSDPDLDPISVTHITPRRTVTFSFLNPMGCLGIGRMPTSTA